MPKPSQNLQDWIDARRRFHLTRARADDAQLNPNKLGKSANHDQEHLDASLFLNGLDDG